MSKSDTFENERKQINNHAGAAETKQTLIIPYLYKHIRILQVEEGVLESSLCIYFLTFLHISLEFPNVSFNIPSHFSSFLSTRMWTEFNAKTLKLVPHILEIQLLSLLGNKTGIVLGKLQNGLPVWLLKVYSIYIEGKSAFPIFLYRRHFIPSFWCIKSQQC